MAITFNSTHELKVAFEAHKIEIPTMVGIRNYESKESEVANHLVSLGTSYSNAKQEDLINLQLLGPEDYEYPAHIAPYAAVAHQELLESLSRNTSPDIDEHTQMSRAQLAAYTEIVPNIHQHNRTGELYMFARRISKNVITPGNYKNSNPRPKTVAKRIIDKDFRSNKYRRFILKDINHIRINKKELIFEME